jgi:hypothetical protein
MAKAKAEKKAAVEMEPDPEEKDDQYYALLQ